MSKNPEQNTQVSAEVEGSLPAPTDAPAPERPAEGPEPTAHLAELLKEAEDEAARLKDAWLRAKAETENVRKQAQNDLAKAHKYAIERFAQELLTVKDALELSLATPNATTGCCVRRSSPSPKRRTVLRRGRHEPCTAGKPCLTGLLA